MAQQFIPTPGGNIYPDENTDYDQSEAFRKVALNRDVVDGSLLATAGVGATGKADAAKVAANAYTDVAVKLTSRVRPISHLPSLTVTDWVGVELIGVYGITSPANAATIIGRPVGANGLGAVSINPIASGASIVVWHDAENGREWQRTVGGSYVTDWAETMRKGTKRVCEPLTLAGGSSVNTSTDVGVRIPFSVPAPVRRWRVHLRNQNDRTPKAYPGELSFTGISVGHAETDTDGRPTGQYTGEQMFPVATAFKTGAEGTQWVSQWMTYPLVPNQEYILSYGYTCAPQDNHASVGGGFLTNGGSAAINTLATGLTKTGQAPLDIWIAYEVDEHVKQYAYLGDSLTAGLSADLPVYDSWAKRHAHAHGAFAQIYAYSGTGYVEWASDTKYGIRKYVDYSQISKPDVLYNAMGSNDLTPSDLSQMIARFRATIAAFRTKVCTNIVNLTVLPRLNGGDTFEQHRQAWNQHLIEQVPGSTLMTFDAAAALEGSTPGVLDERWRASPTDIHLNYAGYARYASGVQ